MKTIKRASIVLFLLLVNSTFAQNQKTDMKTQQEYPKALASYDDFRGLVDEVEAYRKERLLSLNDFLKMADTKNVVVLDTRSTFRYDRKHLRGAIHLSFTDFTQSALEELIPDTNTKILIYCNNNFDGDQIDFASKMSMPKVDFKKGKIDLDTDDASDSSRLSPKMETQILSNRKPIMLALNIPTYINLFGYGYPNIYELGELVNVNDPRIQFEGSEVE